MKKTEYQTLKKYILKGCNIIDNLFYLNFMDIAHKILGSETTEKIIALHIARKKKDKNKEDYFQEEYFKSLKDLQEHEKKLNLEND